MFELEFVGAAQEVTGSCHWLRVGRQQILIDCGLIQGQNEERNYQPFPFDARRIDAVVLTHAHLDHCGRLPLLIEQGFRGPIYTHAASADLAAILLEDAGYLQEKDAEAENRKRERRGRKPVTPLYTREQAKAVAPYFQPLPFAQRHTILPGIELRLNDAGHILGAACVELWLEAQGTQRKLVFSGDLGRWDAPILRDPQLISDADLVILESTYGDRLHRPWSETQAEVLHAVEQCRDSGGNILIPAFSVGRTQEILYAFHRHFNDWGLQRWQVFLDSPLATKATAIYRRHFDLYDHEARAAWRDSGDLFSLPNLHITETPEDSMALNRIKSGAIIIAGSGMCNGGRIRHHLKHNLWRRECQVLIVGFQAQGTLGRQLIEGARFVRLWGEAIRVRAQIHTVGGLSAHADQAELLRWYAGFKSAPPVAIVHGEPPAMAVLAERLHQDFNCRVQQPQPGTRIDLRQL